MADFDDPPEISAEAMARAEAALAGLSLRYLGWAEADMARLRARLDEVRAAGPDAIKALAAMFTISHDMKGQAATFGYPLITELGNRLCRRIETCPSPAHQDLERIARLVEAIGEVLGARLEGDGGEAGRRLLDETDAP